mmetsp:Transcript_55793/g.163084  ORF Transcript_55793/g.163084 Transcript_55793/m.163084 type:complete len:263 (+) Transcript_55793:1292-2080(+)
MPTMGPSRPMGKPAERASTIPTMRTRSTRTLKMPRMRLPLRKLFASGRPEPAQTGATRTTKEAATEAKTTQMPASAGAPKPMPTLLMACCTTSNFQPSSMPSAQTMRLLAIATCTGMSRVIAQTTWAGRRWACGGRLSPLSPDVTAAGLAGTTALTSSPPPPLPGPAAASAAEASPPAPGPALAAALWGVSNHCDLPMRAPESCGGGGCGRRRPLPDERALPGGPRGVLGSCSEVGAGEPSGRGLQLGLLLPPGTETQRSWL